MHPSGVRRICKVAVDAKDVDVKELDERAASGRGPRHKDQKKTADLYKQLFKTRKHIKERSNDGTAIR